MSTESLSPPPPPTPGKGAGETSVYILSMPSYKSHKFSRLWDQTGRIDIIALCLFSLNLSLCLIKAVMVSGYYMNKL